MPSAMGLPLHMDVPVYVGYYEAAFGPQLPTRPGAPVQHHMASMGENSVTGDITPPPPGSLE